MTFKVYSRFEMLHKALKKSRTGVWTFEGRCNGISKCKEITCATVAKTFPPFFQKYKGSLQTENLCTIKCNKMPKTMYTGYI